MFKSAVNEMEGPNVLEVKQAIVWATTETPKRIRLRYSTVLLQIYLHIVEELLLFIRSFSIVSKTAFQQCRRR